MTLRSILVLGTFLFAVACGGSTEPTDTGTVESKAKAGHPDPPACAAVMPECGPDQVVADVDGDGCALECKEAPKCSLAIVCAEGTWPVDTDQDGCEDACKPAECPPVYVQCGPGEEPGDTDGDGCALECRPK